MRKLLALGAMLLLPALSFAQNGTFSIDYQVIPLDSVGASNDSTLIDTVSSVYPGYPTMTVWYKFLDAGAPSTKIFAETKIRGRLSNTEWVKVDSINVTTAFRS